MNKVKESKKMGSIVSKCWANEDFKKKFISDPISTLQAEGVNVPIGIEVRVVENTEKVFHIVLPPKPMKEELPEEYFVRVANEFSVFNGCNPKWEYENSDGYCECCGEDMGVY